MIGPALSAGDRKALIEYLKTLLGIFARPAIAGPARAACQARVTAGTGSCRRN